MSGLTYVVKYKCTIFYMFNRYSEARTETVGIGLICRQIGNLGTGTHLDDSALTRRQEHDLVW